MCGGRNLGVIAVRDLEEDELVLEFFGDVYVTLSKEWQKTNEILMEEERKISIDTQGPSTFRNQIEIGLFTFELTSSDCDGRYVNNSCSPNCHLELFLCGNKPRLGLFASRKIAKDEEITFRYGHNKRTACCGRV
mmetsp:Transcript_35264/g.69575  ORF Transcript_35264/g.69575 Transcript_35264/m.69575 type:complete len:135 (+) Transcript_35264:282-686(+)